MKQFLISLCLTILLGSISLRSAAQDQDVKIPISVISSDTSSFGRLLLSRLQQAVSKTGMSEYDSYNFVMFPRVNVLSHEVTASAPSLTVVNLEVTLIVANGYMSKSIIFNTETFSIKGVGKSYEKALLEAARSLRSDNPKLQELIGNSRATITRYFAANCESIIGEAELMSKQALLAINKNEISDKAVTAENQFTRAIYLLYNIRSANYGCYKTSIAKINQILAKYDEFSCRLYLGRARNHWAARQLKETISYLNKIPPSESCRTEVDALLRQIDGYQEKLTGQDYKHELELLRMREKASKDMLEIVVEGQKKETQAVRESRRQETVVNLMSVMATPR
ncbi:hypothetical protein LZD49_10040 [Dyadobacter sp. CY261]|uniref:hypothetical protein n=1 Tax=Dyadobacter sp. CY261 TaxID=2907203 RepID=UPI001F322832|nr:hypothetical protein [Dyadobacter sp. CY261]MCF0070812.1 hypothetical protein [Dyadobacter sp. CY261]